MTWTMDWRRYFARDSSKRTNDGGVRRAGIPTSQLQRQRSSRVERIKKWFSITAVLKR